MSLHERLKSLLFEGAPVGDDDCKAKLERNLEFSAELQEIVEAHHN